MRKELVKGDILTLKVVAFNGSPRKDGNTSILIRYILEELEKEGIETELVHIGGESIRGCTACMKCFENKDRHCVIDNDIVNRCIDKMIEADGIIFGSPVYSLDITSGMKGLIERAGFVSRANGFLFKRKIGVAVTAVRRLGGSRTLDTLLNFIVFQGMIVPGVPVLGLGTAVGDVEKDAEGIALAKEAGKNMSWILKTLAKG